MTSISFRQRIRRSIADQDLQIALDANANRRQAGRLQALATLPDPVDCRHRAHAVKADVIEHLEEYLDRFIQRVEANGIQVRRARDAGDAVRIFLEIARQHGAHSVVKSKSMVSEEIHFNHAVEAAGLRVIETDLGEYIIQLRGERPSHILTPAVHLHKEQVGQLFHEKLDVPYTDDIPEMVATARKVLRQEFIQADIGVSGVNFGVVETGTLCLVTNEGNGRMVTSVPPVHVALMGIERMVPTLDDLALFLSLLPRSGTGQKLSSYTSLIHSPKRSPAETGPEERYLILVDNGRLRVQASPLAEALYCIRCGACLNACPVFRELGGHAYIGRDGSIAPYPGPIGSVVSPALLGCLEYGQLAQASSLCGACREACPVEIDLPELLLRIRAGDVGMDLPCKPAQDIPAPVWLVLKVYRLIASNPGLFHFSQRLGGFISRILAPRYPFLHLPSWTGWGYSKDLPRPDSRPFRDRWKDLRQTTDGGVPSASLPQEAQSAVQPAFSSPARFIQELTQVGGSVYPTTRQALPGKLIDFLKSRGIERLQADAAALQFTAVLKEAGISLVDKSEYDLIAGLTDAVAGISETGSLVLTGGVDRSLMASLFPDIHIAVLEASRLVDSLEAALSLPEVRSAPASVLITGPSRTADIEMALAIGVHGPKEVHVFLIDEDSPIG